MLYGSLSDCLSLKARSKEKLYGQTITAGQKCKFLHFYLKNAFWWNFLSNFIKFFWWLSFSIKIKFSCNFQWLFLSFFYLFLCIIFLFIFSNLFHKCIIIFFFIHLMKKCTITAFKYWRRDAEIQNKNHHHHTQLSSTLSFYNYFESF